jgi:hypothetical protein
MKTLFTFIAFLFLLINAKAQLSVTIVPSNNHGYGVTCHGSGDGTASAIPTDGTEPYTYEWSTSGTTQSIENLSAGNYTVTVTDAESNTATQTVEINQPNTLSLTLTPKVYPGLTNISAYGLSDGFITPNVSGGTPPYSYAWSSNYVNSGVPAGTYSLTITDMNSCSTYQSATLTQPALLQISSLTSPKHNGYEVSCNGGKDGEIDIEATGGIAPYKYLMGANSAAQGLDHLPKGSYTIVVTDVNGATVSGNIQLAEPNKLFFRLQPSLFPNEYNLSCYECANGTATAINVIGGAGSYSYLWQNDKDPAFPLTGQGTNQITGLMSSYYSISITDGNQCSTKGQIYLDQPSKNAWSMTGDAETNPEEHFIGTTDAKDFVIKTNNEPRITVSSNGSVTIPHLEVDSLHINATNIQADTFTVKHITDTIMVARIMPLPGDSLIHMGDSSLVFNAGYNRMYGNPAAGTYRGTGIGQYSWPIGVLSLALGYNTWAQADHSICLGMNTYTFGMGSISIGSNFGIAMQNDIPFSLMIGMHTSGTMPTLFVGPADGTQNSVGKVGIATKTPNATLDVNGDANVSLELHAGSGGYNFYADGHDLILGQHDGRYQGYHPENRALVHSDDNHDQLIINYAGDFESGVRIHHPNTSNYYDNIIWLRPPSLIVDGVLSTDAIKVNNHLTAQWMLSLMPDHFPGCDDGNNNWDDWANYDGKVAIGHFDGQCMSDDSYSNYNLFVKKGIKTEKLKIESPTEGGWPDYVFKNNYIMLPLSELQKYISENSHLPNIPTSGEVKKDGIDVGEMQGKLLSKIEELTLYIIDLQKQIDDLKKK